MRRKACWSQKVEVFLPSIQCLIPRMLAVMVLYRSWLLVIPKWMEENTIPINLFPHHSVTTKVSTHLWWVFAACCVCCMAITLIMRRYTDLIHTCSVRQVASHSSFMIGIQQNSLEDFGTKYYLKIVITV